MQIVIREVDPLGIDALTLLKEAAAEAQQLYPEFHDPMAPGPTNAPTPARGVYLVAFADGQAVGMAAHRPIDATSSEVRRMFVTRQARGRGVARALLAHIEAHARAQGFTRLVLETGHRQQPAIQLYASSGFSRIPAFGPYVDDPTSVCFAKTLAPAPGGLRPA